MKRAWQTAESLLEEVRGSLQQTHDRFAVWWLGQSGFLVQWQGRHLLLDPYLSDSLTTKYAATDKPHVRMTQLVVRPEQLNWVDVVTSSHNHTDHLDAETLVPLLKVNPSLQVLVPAANRSFAAQRLQVPEDRLRAVDVGESCELAGFTITGVAAAHERLDRDAEGRYCYLGYLVRFGPWTIYHSGDTVLYEGMEQGLREAAGPTGIDLAMLPINGRGPERRVSGNLWGHEAARLANSIGANCVIPCHYDMFTFNTANPDQFVATCRELGQPFAILENGQRWISSVRPTRDQGNL